MGTSVVIGIIAAIIALVIYREYRNEKRYRKEREYQQQKRREKKLSPKVTKRPSGTSPRPSETSVSKPVAPHSPAPKKTVPSRTEKRTSTADQSVPLTQKPSIKEKHDTTQKKKTQTPGQKESLQPKPDLKSKPSVKKVSKPVETEKKSVKTERVAEKRTVQKTDTPQKTTAPESLEKHVPPKKTRQTEKKPAQPDLTAKTEKKTTPSPKQAQAETKSSADLPKGEYPDFNYTRLVEMGLSEEEALEFIQELIPQIDTQIPLIDEALQIPDFEKMERLTHSIKGSSTTIGTGGVSDLLVEYNTYLKTGDKVEVAQAYQEHLKRYFEKLKKQFPPKS
jgi:HPt (histidine-containing phosphotransfer) domain-containing protein